MTRGPIIAYADGHDCAASPPALVGGEGGQVVLGWMPEDREWLAGPIRGWALMGGYALTAPIAEGRLRYVPARLSAVPHVLVALRPEILYEVGRSEDSALAARQLVKLDPYFIVGWVRMRDASAALDHRDEVEEAVRQMRAINPKNFAGRFGLLQYALAYGRADEARAALSEIVTRWPEDAGFAQQLLPWALGQSGVDPGKVRAAIADAPENEASYFLIARQDVEAYNADIKTHGAIVEAYYFANLYSSKPAGHAMLRNPRVKATLVDYGFPAYWREKGWPAGCRPLGDADFECGIESASAH